MTTVRPISPSTRHRAATAVAMTGLCVLVGCTTGADDYRRQTETYLNDDSEPEFELTEGADISDASCEEPASLDIGTRYVCTATVDGFGTRVFVAEIDAENSFRVSSDPLDS